MLLHIICIKANLHVLGLPFLRPQALAGDVALCVQELGGEYCPSSGAAYCVVGQAYELVVEEVVVAEAANADTCELK
jgi:hypothetical protein